MKKLKYLLLGLAAIMVMGLTGCGGAKLDITDYVSVQFSGADGQGNAVCRIDSVALEQALVGDEDGEISMDELQKLAWVTQFEMGLTGSLDKETGLSNGDTVTVTLDYDKKLAKENKVAVTGTTKEFKVEGLTE